MMTQLQDDALTLLKELIKIQSFSKEEDGTADLLEKWFADKGIVAARNRNNVWAVNQHFDAAKPTLLLNSHHDTVKPNAAYTRDPFLPTVVDGKLYTDWVPTTLEGAWRACSQPFPIFTSRKIWPTTS